MGLRLPLPLLMPTPSTATTDTVWPTTATDTVWPTMATDTVWPTMVTMDTLMPTTPTTAPTGMLTTDTDTDTATLTVDITAIPMPTTDTMATARSKPAWISSSRFVRFEDLAAVKLVKYLVT